MIGNNFGSNLRYASKMRDSQGVFMSKLMLVLILASTMAFTGSVAGAQDTSENKPAKEAEVELKTPPSQLPPGSSNPSHDSGSAAESPGGFQLPSYSDPPPVTKTKRATQLAPRWAIVIGCNK